jgi:hypothetical protein
MMIGKTLDDLKLLCTIRGQKDVRPLDMSNNYRKLVGVYGRPQDGHATGDISYVEVETPYHITEDIVLQAPIITKGLFPEGVWCGANDAIHLSNGHNLVLGHVARYNLLALRGKEYHGMHLFHDPMSNRIYNLDINGSGTDYPPIDGLDLLNANIHFSGGADEELDPTSLLVKVIRDIGNLSLIKTTCGLGDGGAGRGGLKVSVAA